MVKQKGVPQEKGSQTAENKVGNCGKTYIILLLPILKSDLVWMLYAKVLNR